MATRTTSAAPAARTTEAVERSKILDRITQLDAADHSAACESRVEQTAKALTEWLRPQRDHAAAQAELADCLQQRDVERARLQAKLRELTPPAVLEKCDGLRRRLQSEINRICVLPLPRSAIDAKTGKEAPESVAAISREVERRAGLVKKLTQLIVQTDDAPTTRDPVAALEEIFAQFRATVSIDEL